MTEQKNRAQFGLWKSPITPISLASGLGFSDLAWDQDGTLVWRESRSNRSTLIVQPPDGEAPVTSTVTTMSEPVLDTVVGILPLDMGRSIL